jgi:hypothetical protein
LSIEEVKGKICWEFSEHYKEDIKANDYTLYTLDAFDEPSKSLRRKDQSLAKLKVSSGDLLCLKSNAVLTKDETLKLYIHATGTGLPGDSKYVQDLEVSQEYSLTEFKEVLMELPALAGATKDITPDHVRVRI